MATLVVKLVAATQARILRIMIKLRQSSGSPNGLGHARLCLPGAIDPSKLCDPSKWIKLRRFWLQLRITHFVPPRISLLVLLHLGERFLAVASFRKMRRRAWLRLRQRDREIRLPTFLRFPSRANGFVRQIVWITFVRP